MSILYKQYFEEVYEHYPRKEAKESAFLEYCKVANNREIPQDELIDKVKRYAYKMKGSEKYCITLYKWLNGKRWEDDLPNLPTTHSTDSSKAKNIIIKLGSGSASPDSVRWLKGYINKYGVESLNLKPADIAMIAHL